MELSALVIAGILAVFGALFTGVRFDRDRRKRQSDAMRRLRDRDAKAEKQAADVAHKSVDTVADVAKADPAPTDADVQIQRDKMRELWAKLKKHRGRFH